MAQYKIGNCYLTEEEYDAQSLAVWRFMLFVIGAVAAGTLLHGVYPEELSKLWRFVVSVGAAVCSVRFYNHLIIRRKIVFIARHT